MPAPAKATKPVLLITVQEKDTEGLNALSIVDMLTRDMPSAGRIRADGNRGPLREAIMTDIGRYVDMLLDGTADDIRIERTSLPD